MVLKVKIKGDYIMHFPLVTPLVLRHFLKMFRYKLLDFLGDLNWIMKSYPPSRKKIKREAVGILLPICFCFVLFRWLDILIVLVFHKCSLVSLTKTVENNSYPWTCRYLSRWQFSVSSWSQVNKPACVFFKKFTWDLDSREKKKSNCARIHIWEIKLHAIMNLSRE